MAIKLKKLTDSKKDVVLFGSWIVFIVLCSLIWMCTVYGTGGRTAWWPTYDERGKYLTASVIIGIVAFALGIFNLYGTWKYWNRRKTTDSIKKVRADAIKLELVLAIGAAVFFIWIKGMISLDLYAETWNLGVIVTVSRVQRFLVILILLSTVFMGSVVLLLRKHQFGTVKETSLIWTEIHHYRERTPLEKKLGDRRKLSLILEILCTAGIVGLAVNGYVSPYKDIWAVLTGIAALLAFILFLKTWISGGIERETGYLVQQIHAMVQGEPLSGEHKIPEDSLLYEASRELENIGAAMEKSAQKQIQAERLKIDLITNVSHDLKTPLTSMVGYIDLLKKEDLSDAARDYVEVLGMKEEQLKAMIQDLFELSKATSQTEQLHMEILDMEKLIEQILGDMEDVTAESGQSIRTSFKGHPLTFLGDNNKMYRVVQNLLENALKYSLAGTRIYVDVKKEGDFIETAVKNIASYEMDFEAEEITERFARGDKSRSTEGHGLGLAIASSFTRNMGGSLGVEIDGDMFKVTMKFPCKRGEDE